MAPATARPARAGKADSPPATFDEIARTKMADTLTEYRTLVARCAGGEQLTSDELGRALELLAYMGLPDYAWHRDLKAQHEHTANVQSEAQLAADMPAAEVRAAEATKRIEELEKELRTLREQQHRDVRGLPSRLVGYGQRRHELAALHPHLFAAVDDAARLRIADRNKARPMPAEPLGWSTT